MDEAVREVLREVSEQALEILTENRDILENAARHLLEVETLDEDALRDLAKGLRRGTPSETSDALTE
jgi:cell division protease FtsH